MTNKEVNKILDKLPEVDSYKDGKKEINKITDLPKPVKKAIDEFNEHNSKAKNEEELANSNKRLVVDYVSEVQQGLAEEGKHFKSLRLQGNSSEVTFTRANKFSVSKDTDFKEISKIVGAKFAKENFEKVRTLQVNPDVMKDAAKLKVLVEKLNKAFGSELSEYFVQEQTVVPKKSLEESRFELDKDKRAALDELVKQQKGSIKS
jgi:hypothetical protein